MMMRIGPAIFLAAVLSMGTGASFSVQAEELRDPMQPPEFALAKMREARWKNKPKQVKPVVAKKPEKPLVLTSILISKNRRIAIIDDQMLAVGDKIRGAKLTRISRQSVRLVRHGKVINLNLNNDLTAIKKKAVESDL